MNPWEENAREKKCRAMARHIVSKTIEVLRDCDDDVWSELAKESKVGVPSDESKKRVIQILEGLL